MWTSPKSQQGTTAYDDDDDYDDATTVAGDDSSDQSEISTFPSNLWPAGVQPARESHFSKTLFYVPILYVLAFYPDIFSILSHPNPVATGYSAFQS